MVSLSRFARPVSARAVRSLFLSLAAGLTACLAMPPAFAASDIPVAVSDAIQVEPYQGLPMGPRLAVIGDSITAMSGTQLHTELDPFFLVSVDGRHGHTIAQQLPVAQLYGHQSPPPSIVAINLGTNDDSADTDLTSADADLRHLLDQFPSVSCVVLTTINANTMSTDRNTWANSFNFWTLFALSQSDSRVRIADWNTEVRRYYDSGQPNGELTYDMVHPTPLGQTHLASLTHDALTSCPS
jgi:hypothetical protein